MIKTLANNIIKILDYHKGEKILLMSVEKHTVIADYFVIAQGNTVQHVKSMADYLIDELKKHHDIVHIRMDGYDEGKWIVIDYGDIIVHLFRKEEREYYNDVMRKVRFEIKNFFRPNSRIVYSANATFCPFVTGEELAGNIVVATSAVRMLSLFLWILLFRHLGMF
jgi:ribosome-associated protein